MDTTGLESTLFLFREKLTVIFFGYIDILTMVVSL